LSCVSEPALLKAVVILSTWDWILRIKQIQPEQVGNKKHLALFSSQGAVGSDQLTGGERLRHRTAFSHLQSKDQIPGVSNPPPGLSKLLSTGNAEEKYKDTPKPGHYFYLVCMRIKKSNNTVKGR